MPLSLASIQPIDWDRWRDEYDSMTFAEHQQFNARVRDRYPHQRSWSEPAARGFLLARQPKSVVELGGWDGSLAAALLPDFGGVDSWVNYDLTPGVPQVCEDARYERVVIDDWPWNQDVQADALIASHVFEHMRIHEIEQLVERWDVKSIYVDCPIFPVPQSWFAYEGTHILEVGSTELMRRFDRLGYRVTRVYNGQFIAYFDR